MQTPTPLVAYGPTVGRVLLGLLFLASGLSMAFMQGPGNVAGYFASLGIPLSGIAAYAVIVLKVGAGGALVAGIRSDLAAMALILFTLAATLIAHLDISDTNLFKNLAIIGGLLYVIADHARSDAAPAVSSSK